MNYIAIFILGVIAGFIFDYLFAYAQTKFKKQIKIRALRFHHSCIGLICIILSFFIYFVSLVSFGVGVIISHTIRSKEFLFVEYKKRRFF